MSNSASFTVAEDVQRMRDEIFLLRLDHAILVEGKSDEPFWRYFWDKIVPDRYKIYAYVHFPTADTSSKTALVGHFLPYASRDLIFCLDSDYDYLLEKPFLSQPFVFQTYVYSIENFRCYAPALSEVLRTGVGNEEAYFDFDLFFQQYSRFAYWWLTIKIYQYETTGVPIGRPPDFVTLVSNVEETFVNFQKLLAFQALLQRLSALGLREQNAYLFIRGHDLEQLMLKLLKAISQPIIEQEFARRTPEERAEYAQYQKQHTFEVLLQRHRYFEECNFYILLLADAIAALR